MTKINVKSFLEYYYFHPNKAPSNRKKMWAITLAFWGLTSFFGPLACSLVSWKRGRGFYPKKAENLSTNDKKAREVFSQTINRSKSTETQCEEELFKHANLFSAQGMNELADKNDPLNPSLTEARGLYLSLAERGHFLGSFQYAWFCQQGYGGAQDFGEAKKYFKFLAKEYKDEVAMQALAGFYLEGQGVERSLSKGVEWLKKAAIASKWDPRVCFKIGMLYLNEESILDPVAADHWFKKAAEKNHFGAEKQLELLEKL